MHSVRFFQKRLSHSSGAHPPLEKFIVATYALAAFATTMAVVTFVDAQVTHDKQNKEKEKKREAKERQARESFDVYLNESYQKREDEKRVKHSIPPRCP